MRDSEFGHRAAIVFHPHNPDLVYATAGAPAKVYKSIDAGRTWSTANNGLPESRVFALHVNPDNPLIIHAACGEEGIYMTNNGGQTWALSGTSKCHFLDRHPADPKMLLAGTKGLLKKSCDGGLSWIEVRLPTVMMRLANAKFDPSDKHKVFAGTFGNGGFIGIQN